MSCFLRVFLVFVLSFEVVAAPSQKRVRDRKIDRIFDQVHRVFQSSEKLQIAITKNYRNKLLGTEKKYKGDVFIAAGQMRWDLRGIRNTTVLLDKNQTLWSITHPDKDLGETKPSITRSKLSNLREGSLIVGILTGQNVVKKFFSYEKFLEKGSKVELFLKPKKTSNYKKLKIVVEKKKKHRLIREISFQDELDNKVQFLFSKMQFKAKFSEKIFSYKPPQGIQILDLTQ